MSENPLQEKALRVLEFVKIREQLAEHALTESGAALCMQLLPYETLGDASHAQAATEEAHMMLTWRGEHPLMSFKDIRPSLNMAVKGAVLSTRSLIDIADSLRAASVARTALVGEKDRETPILTDLAQILATNYPLERGIKDAIISEEEIADGASTELASIRRQIRLSNDRVKERLRVMTQSASFSKYLQEPIVTMRNGRYVLPVRQEYRQQVPGLVHDQSSSGATLFIEPMSVVELGNDLKQWYAKEEQEIERILSAFSAQVAINAPQLETNVEILTQLDFIFAKGALARTMHAIRPKMNNEGRLRFVQVRHPLLPLDTVVPCDLWLGDDFTTLIITGPNTGGKTVTLKTVGLISLMAQSGLHVPGKLGTETAIFRQVYADIGDEQSIEQSLSTFSSHMTNIVSILEEVEPEDLVLFDELGAGTDPTEGAALAQAILNTLGKRRVRCVATTHYSELKAYALSTKGVENASVEFDVSTLRPTYRLSIGVPGKSNAFEISQRLGLPLPIIDAARELLSHESIVFEDVIANAEYHRQLAEKERALAHEAYEESQQLRRDAQAHIRSLEADKEQAKKKAREEARRILERTKRESAAILDELKLMRKGGSGQDGASLRRRLQDLEDALSEGIKHTGSFESPQAEDLRVGDTVEVPHLNAVGTVLSLPDNKDELMIQAGILKMRVQLDQIRLSASKPKKKTSVRTSTQAGSRTVKMECDVRGMALDEAMLEVARYLDSALLAGMHEVSIVHGKGTGTLRAGIQQQLKGMRQVKSYRLGQYGEGESGVTIVELR